MSLCPSIEFFGGSIMCMPLRSYEALGLVMRVTKGLWPLYGQGIVTAKLGSFLAKFLFEC